MNKIWILQNVADFADFTGFGKSMKTRQNILWESKSEYFIGK